MREFFNVTTRADIVLLVNKEETNLTLVEDLIPQLDQQLELQVEDLVDLVKINLNLNIKFPSLVDLSSLDNSRQLVRQEVRSRRNRSRRRLMVQIRMMMEEITIRLEVQTSMERRRILQQ